MGESLVCYIEFHVEVHIRTHNLNIKWNQTDNARLAYTNTSVKKQPTTLALYNSEALSESTWAEFQYSAHTFTILSSNLFSSVSIVLVPLYLKVTAI